MRWRSDHHQRIFHEGFGAHVRALRRLAHDGEVGDVLGELLDDGIAVGDGQADLYLGMCLDEFRQQLRHEIVGGADHGDVQVAALQPFHFVEHRFHFLHQLQHRARIVQQFVAGRREMQLFAGLLEQRQAHRTLRLLDLHRNGGLRQIQFRRRARMIKMAGYAFEDLQLA